MGYAEDKTNIFLPNLRVKKKSRGNIYKEKPVFFDNGASVIIASGSSCHLYNTSTGNHVKKLFDCSENIISCQLNPVEENQVVAISENGQVVSFDLKTNELKHSFNLTLCSKTLKSQNLPKFACEKENEDEQEGDGFDWESQPVHSMAYRKFVYAEVRPYQGNPSELFVWATWCLNDESRCHLSVFSFKEGKHFRYISFRKVGFSKCHLNFILSSFQGTDVFVGACGNLVYAANFPKKNLYYYNTKKHFLGQNIRVSCLTFHPVECSFATGDTLGRVIVWRNIFEKHPLKDMFHWHTLPVRDVAFSKFGNYIFSGGDENVLVKWSLSSRSRDFLPRLSSAIYHISVCSEASLISVSMSDNRVLIINLNFEKVSTIQSFSRWSFLKEDIKRNVFAIDPRTESLVLNGKTGHLQFLSLKEDGKFMYTFDVTNRNYVTSDSSSAIENTEVTHAAFCGSGRWMVTAECRNGGQYKDVRLKFWEYREKETSYSLNTNVELPHEDWAVHCLAASLDDKVATTGGDGKFRLWTVFESQQVNYTKEVWAVEAANKYRNLLCGPIDFSKDDSLVVVGFGSVLTVWETSSAVLKCSLSVPFRKEVLEACKFGNKEFSHLVVTATDRDVTTWNTITLSVMWTVPVRTTLLVSDPCSIYMAAFSAENSLILFNPGSPSADFMAKNVAPSPVIAAHPGSNEESKFSLYFLTARQDLYCLEDEEKINFEAVSAGLAFASPYAVQLAPVRNDPESEKREPVALNRIKQKSVLRLVEAPAHTLPNPSLLCSEVLKGMLLYSGSDSRSSTGRKEDDSGMMNKLKKEEKAESDEELEILRLRVMKSIFK